MADEVKVRITASAEEVGEAARKAAQELANAARLIVGQITPAQAAVGGLGVAVAQAAAAAQEAGGRIATSFAAIGEAASASQRLFSESTTAIATGVERMGAGLADAARVATGQFEPAKVAVGGLAEAITAAAQTAERARGIGNLWQGLADGSQAARAGVEGLARGISEAARAATANTAITNLFQGIADGARTATSAEVQFKTMFEGIGRAASSAASTAGSAIKSISAGIVVFNQGLDLLSRGARLVESAWAGSIGAVVSRGGELDDLARRFGTTADSVSRLDFVARQAGVSVEPLFQGYRTLSRVLVEAGEAGSEANRTLVGGLKLTTAEIEHLKTLKPEDAILAVGRALDAYPDSAEKAAAAQTLFGRGAETVFQLLRQGDEEIRRSAALAERLGVVMDTETAKAADRLGDALGTTDSAWQGFLAHALGGPDFLNRLATQVENAVVKFSDMARAIPDERVQQLQGAVEGLITAAANFATGSGPQMVETLTKIVNALSWIIEHAPSAGSALQAAAGAGVGYAMGGLPGAALLGTTGAVHGGVNDYLAGLQSQATAPPWQGGTGRIPIGQSGGEIGETSATPTDIAAADAAAARASSRKRLVIPGAPDSGGGGISEAGEAFFRDQERQLQVERENAARRLEIIRGFTEQAKLLFGERSEEYQKQIDIQTDAEVAAADESKDVLRVRIDAERDGALAALDLKRQAREADFREGRITEAQANIALKEYWDERYDIVVAALDKIGALTDDPVRQAQLAAMRGAAVAEQTAGKTAVDLAPSKTPAPERAGHALAEGTIDFQALADQADQTFAQIGRAQDKMIADMVAGTFEWRKAWRSAAVGVGQELAVAGAQMVRTALADVAKMVAGWILGETTKTTATATGEEARIAIKRASNLKDVFMAAKTAAANAYSAMSGVPYVGPILGAAAAVAVFAAVMALGSFKEGGNVPEDMLAQVHKDEMVLPAAIADSVRAMASGATGGTTQEGAAAGVPAAAGAPGPAGDPGAPKGDEDPGRPRREGDAGGGVAGADKDKTGAGAIGLTVTPPAFTPVTAGGGGGGGPGGRGIQSVRIVGSSATLSTKSQGGTISTTAEQPVQTTPVGGVMPVQDTQQIKQVMIMNQPLRVAFSAITSMFTVYGAPFGVGISAGIGFMSAFAKGGDVPEDMIAKLHAKEMVLPAYLAEGLRSILVTGAPPSAFPDDVVASTRASQRLGSRVGGAMAERSDEERAALTGALAEVGLNHFEQHNSFQMIDGRGAREFIEDNGLAIAEQGWKHTTRQNHGLRGRR
jgi:hypothetical protein